MSDNKIKRTIDYVNYDFDVLKGDLINQLIETKTFKDANFEGSGINNLSDLIAYVGALYGYYINSAANEVYSPTAKRYNNLNKIAQLLKYDARGTTSATLDVVGLLNPEYVMGKSGENIEIPSYSIFPSTKQTVDGDNFIFTNTLPAIYIIKGFGVRILADSDITYKGYALPFTATKSFFQESGSTSAATIDPTQLSLPLNLYKNLRVIKRSDPTKYRSFDTDTYPLTDPNDATSSGQPFDKTIDGTTFASTMAANTEYSVLLTYDSFTSNANLEIVTDTNILNDRADDIIGKLKLELVDSVSDLYKLYFTEVSTDKRFYIGKTGLNNLESTSIEFDKITGKPNSVERIKLVINKDGTNPPFTVLLNGKYYTFTSGTIYSSKFKENYFSNTPEYYNVNLSINDPDSPEINYGASLEVTTKDPVTNQVTIARIYTRFVDTDSGQATLSTDPGKKHGDLKVVEKVTYKSSQQKSGRIYFNKNDTQQRIIFSSVFTPEDTEVTSDYFVQLSSTSNVRKWYSDKTETGFDIYVEPNTQFEGYVDWVATKIIQNKVKSIPVVFNSPLPQVVTTTGSGSNFMVNLTATDNVEVWYDNVTESGFEIKTELDFEGKVSWSVYNFFDDQSSATEVASVYKQTGQAYIPADNTDGIEVTLDVPFNDDRYAIQLVGNKNINTFYSDKSKSSFKIKKEPGINEDVVVDWYVDGTTEYRFQRHGEVEFNGRSVISSAIPGLRFIDVPESFIISNLMQGSVGFSYINVNNVIDPLNNFLQVRIDPTKVFEKSLSFIIDNTTIAMNSIRVFVRNTAGNWDEWKRFGTGYDQDNNPGSKVFSIRTNPDKKLKVEFGDGVNWGTAIAGKEIFILGLSSVGSQGNINKNVLDTQVTLSQYILGNDRTDIDFETSLVSIIGLKSKVIFEGATPSTSIIDSESTKLNEKDLIIQQNQLAFGGADVETVDELRSNISNSFTRQNRNVSVNDVTRYINEFFFNYIVTSQTLTFNEVKALGLVSSDDLSKYWYNTVFIVALNKDGTNIINKSLRDLIVTNLNSSQFKMIGKEHEVIAAKWVPIDVLIRYKKDKTANTATVETEMRRNLVEFFQTANHSLGDYIAHSDVLNIVNVAGVENIEVMINKDPDNKFLQKDYDVTISNVQNEDQVKKEKLLELVRRDPSLVKVFQPLFNTIKSDGTFEYTYSLDIQLGTYEFPKLGDIIIERN